jgi:hypothetical protein
LGALKNPTSLNRIRITEISEAVRFRELLEANSYKPVEYPDRKAVLAVLIYNQDALEELANRVQGD